MNTATLGNISLLEFYTQSLRTMDKQTAAEVIKHTQKGLFEIIWQRLRGDDRVMKIYPNIGCAFDAIISGQAINVIVPRIRSKPITGSIRSPINYHNDFRFVSLVHRDDVYMLLENAAIDSKIDQVWKYCSTMDGFIPIKVDFLNFLLSQKVDCVRKQCAVIV